MREDMKTITVEKFLKLKPCYGKERILKIAGDKTKWSALDILRLEDVHEEDKLWAVLRSNLIDGAVMHEFACKCAERALSRIENPDPRSVEAIAAKRAWVKGEITDEELSTARCAARAAAREAARCAAWTAARCAAWEAAREAAWTAARCAAWEAAREALAREASYKNERKAQVQLLIEMLEEQE